MSLENEHQSSPDKAMETSCQAHKKASISYSREFLLSLSELEICKKLPRGFDASILSEFGDASHDVQDRQRIPGSTPFQGYKRYEYGSSPPTRGDSGSYSRNTYGRWESRSFGRSDRDSDSQSDRDSDSGQRHGNPSRQSWQSFEHDGLLGSGSFPRSSGSTSGTSATKAKANDPYPPNRTNEVYHPPRPYKAVPYTRRDFKDSYNDETFGSSESTSEDRVEEERRRRASFELMRKEQQKALQEKQKLNPEKQKADPVADISGLLDDLKEEKRLVEGSHVVNVPAAPAVSTSDCGKSTTVSHTTTSRPLVPPGFANTIQEKHSGLKSSIHTHKTEVGKPETKEGLLDNGTRDGLERETSLDTTFSDHHLEDKAMHSFNIAKGEAVKSSPLTIEGSVLKLASKGHLRTYGLSETHESNDPDTIEISAKGSDSNVQGKFNQNNSPIILEKIFGSALVMSSSSFTDPAEPKSVHSSKFAQWFSEEEKQPCDNYSYDRPNDLLSLIVGSDNGRSQLSHEIAAEPFPLEPSKESPDALMFMSSLSPTENGVPGQPCGSKKVEATPTVLTCEDLEQKILSEFSDKSSNLQPSFHGGGVAGLNSEEPSRQVDNHASNHLLSLLQKGPSISQMASSPHVEADSDKILISEARDMYGSCEEPREEDLKSNHTLGKSLTLENLFGSAFMKELHSVEAPVSVQRGSVGPSQTDVLEPPGLSFTMNNGRRSSTGNDAGSFRTNHQNDILPSSHRQGKSLDKTKSWLGFDDPQMQLNSSKHQIEVNPDRGRSHSSVEFQLPEEESLVAAADPLHPQNSMFKPAGTSNKGGPCANPPSGIAEKLAAVGAGVKDERYPLGPEGSAFVLSHENEPEVPHHNFHVQSSTPSHSSQMTHGRPVFYPLDPHPTHVNSPMKFMGPESMIPHGLPANHQFATHMIRPHFPQPNSGVIASDPSAHNPVLPRMRIPGNFHVHPSNEFHRSSYLPHPRNQAASMQGFPFGGHQHNPGNLGAAMPAPDVNSGSNQSEAFQRLLEMELRAKSKQIRPLSHGHSQAMYGGHELDMGFQYR